MTTHDKIELPQGYAERPFDYSGDLYTEGQVRAIIKADRERRGEPVKITCKKCNGTGVESTRFHGVWPNGEECLEPIKCDQCDGFGTTSAAEPVKVNAIFETQDGEAIGTTDAKVKRVEWQDDGSLTVVIDYWPQPAEPDLVKCAECGAELIQVRPGKWQHPDCSQSPWASEPVAWPLASPEDADKGWILDYRFIEQVERIASQRTDYPISMEATEHVLISANEVLRASQPAEPLKVDAKASVPIDDLAHEIWAAAQTAPGEGIEDAVDRIAAILARYVQPTHQRGRQ